jgi:hypothetical protein
VLLYLLFWYFGIRYVVSFVLPPILFVVLISVIWWKPLKNIHVFFTFKISHVFFSGASCRQ